MSKTRIFLSSTCYDLRALREHLREKVQEWGHELLLSEYSSFPVAPDQTTIENCRNAIRNHADILVLIVGGKRGSLDESGVRSVVNAEYLEAKTEGLDLFVFVDKQVWDLLPIYQKNPDADFSPVVDHVEVFKFVSDLKSDSRWIYPFTRTEDIILTLRTQLSVHLRSLIERGRAGTLVVPREFASESRRIISLIQERPRFWEFLLVCELVERALADAKKRLVDLDRGLVYRKVERLDDQQVSDRLSRLFRDMSNIATVFEGAMKEVVPALGPPGVSGDAVEIHKACSRIGGLIDALVDWETDLRFLDVPEEYRATIETLHGATAQFIQEISRMPIETRQGLERAKTGPGPHEINVQLKIVAPPHIDRFTKELAKVRSKR